MLIGCAGKKNIYVHGNRGDTLNGSIYGPPVITLFSASSPASFNDSICPGPVTYEGRLFNFRLPTNLELASFGHNLLAEARAFDVNGYYIVNNSSTNQYNVYWNSTEGGYMGTRAIQYTYSFSPTGGLAYSSYDAYSAVCISY